MMGSAFEKEFLLSHIDSNTDVLEWGSGESTIEIARRCKSIVSIEHDPAFAASMSRFISSRYSQLPIQYLLMKPNKQPDDPESDGTYQEFKDYILAPKSLNKEFDIIFIDGRARLECARIAYSLVKSNGFIFIHDFADPPQRTRESYIHVLELLNKVDSVETMWKFSKWL